MAPCKTNAPMSQSIQTVQSIRYLTSLLNLTGIRWDNVTDLYTSVNISADAV